MKSRFWKADWFLGAAVALLMLFASSSDLLQSLERKAYDMGVQASSRTPSDRIAVIAIDDTSIANLGRLHIGTDSAMHMYTYFHKDRDGRPAFTVDSFYDVLSGKIPAEKYRDKIVLIGPTAAGVGSTSVTTIAPAMAPVLALAHAVSSILQEDFFVSPPWAWVAQKLAFLLVAVYLIVLLPRLNAGPAAAITATLLLALIAAHFGLMVARGTWVQLIVPATLLLVGHLALVTKRFIVTERAKLRSDESSAESNRMLGLAYQGQGNLDMAWDKFRQVPMSDALLDNLYNLALDFERKCQYNKAESVLRHMHGFSPKYRDLEQRLTRAKQLSETVMLGGGGGATNTSILGAGGTVEKPMLGRYQVEKELGKGAMGVVYLGRDPKIGRVVAIKTMALAQEFEPDELAEVKDRFFREAETAGRLSHPNIVPIYDAGEEHDLCYIAMELLKGGDLVPFTKPANLLPSNAWFRSSRALRTRSATRTVKASCTATSSPRTSLSPRERHPQGDRLRHRAAHGQLEDEDRHGARHAFVHVARAAGRQEDRRSQRPVLARHQLLPAVVRPPAVRGRVDGAAHVQDLKRAARGRPAVQPAGAIEPRGLPAAGARQEPGRALPDRRGVRAVAACRRRGGLRRGCRTRAAPPRGRRGHRVVRRTWT